MEMIILGIITTFSIVINAVLYRRYSNAKHHLFEAEDRIEDLDMVVAALQSVQLMHDENKPKKKTSKKVSKPAVKSKSKKEVVPAPKKRGRKPKS